MPVIDENEVQVSPFAGIASLTKEQRNDYYYAMYLEMDVLENLLRGLRFDRKYDFASLPRDYHMMSLYRVDETKKFLNHLLDSKDSDVSTQNYEQARKDAYRFYLSLNEIVTELVYQEGELQKLMQLRNVMNDASGVEGKEEKYRLAKELYEKEERRYKAKFLPAQAMAVRLEDIHLPELEVELASIRAAKTCCERLYKQLPGALIDKPLSGSKNTPLADVKKSIADNLAQIDAMGLSGAFQKRKDAMKPKEVEALAALTAKKAVLKAQADADKLAPGKWYVRVKGKGASDSLKTTLDSLNNATDQARTGNSREYRKMVDEAKKLRNLLEGKDEKGVLLQNVTVAMLKAQAEAVKNAANDYLREKRGQTRIIPSRMRTRRMNGANALVVQVSRLEENFTDDWMASQITAGFNDKYKAEKVAVGVPLVQAHRDYDKKNVRAVQEAIRNEVMSDMGMKDPGADPLEEIISTNLNIGEEQNKNNIQYNLSRTGKEGKTIDRITGELQANRNSVMEQQMKDGAKKMNVSETTYQELMKQAQSDKAQRPSQLDGYRKKKTDEYMGEFTHLLERCGSRTSEYADMTNLLNSDDEAEVRDGFMMLMDMANRAQTRGVRRDVFIRSAVQASRYFCEEGRGDVDDISMMAGKLKLIPDNLKDEASIDALMGKWRTTIQAEKKAVRQM